MCRAFRLFFLRWARLSEAAVLSADGSLLFVCCLDEASRTGYYWCMGDARSCIQAASPLCVFSLPDAPQGKFSGGLGSWSQGSHPEGSGLGLLPTSPPPTSTGPWVLSVRPLGRRSPASETCVGEGDLPLAELLHQPSLVLHASSDSDRLTLVLSVYCGFLR